MPEDTCDYLLVSSLVISIKDSLYAIAFANGQSIVIPGTSLSEINWRPRWLQIIFYILYSQ